MNELKVVSINGQLVTESREVAKMIDRQHKGLLRDIRRYIDVLDQSADLRSANFFIESTYTNKNNQSYPCYLLTKQGCEMVANKLTGEKGVLFTAAYVTKFNEMEKQSNQPKSHLEALQLTVKELTSQDKRISNLEENMRINSGQEFHLNTIGKRKVIESLGGYESPAYQKLSKKVFARFWRDFKQHFMIPRYSDLPKVKFDEGVKFIQVRQPDTSTRLEIDAINQQQVIKGVV